MNREFYVPDNQVLHPDSETTYRYNDVNGAVYESTWNDAHGNRFTRNHQVGPAERYGYDYVGGAPAHVHHRPGGFYDPSNDAIGVQGPASASYGGSGYSAAGGTTGRGDYDYSNGAGGKVAVAIILGVLLGPLLIAAGVHLVVWRFRGTGFTPIEWGLAGIYELAWVTWWLDWQLVWITLLALAVALTVTHIVCLVRDRRTES